MPPDKIKALIAQAEEEARKGASEANDTVREATGTDFAAAIAAAEEEATKAAAPVVDAAKDVVGQVSGGGAEQPPASESHWYDALTNPTFLSRDEAENAFKGNPERAVSPRTDAGMLGHAAGAAVSMIPGVGPLARVGLGALGGAISGGSEAYGEDASPEEIAQRAGTSGLWGGLLTGAFEGAGPLLKKFGANQKATANRKLADRAYPNKDLTDIRARGGEAGVAQAGQELRDTGITKSRGIRDYFKGVTPQRLSENSVQILDNANQQIADASNRIMNAPAGEIGPMAEPGPATVPVKVGETPVDVDPVRYSMEDEARRLEYVKQPKAAQTVRNTAEQLLTPWGSEPVPVERLPDESPMPPPLPGQRIEPNFTPMEPAELQSTPRNTGPSAPAGGLDFEPGLPQVPEENLFSSEPVGPIEHGYSTAPAPENPQALPVPPAGPGEFEQFTHHAPAFSTGATELDPSSRFNLEAPLRERTVAQAEGELPVETRVHRPRNLEAPLRERTAEQAASEIPVSDKPILPYDFDNLMSRDPGASFDDTAWSYPGGVQSNAESAADLLPKPEPALGPSPYDTIEHTPRFSERTQPSSDVPLGEPAALTRDNTNLLGPEPDPHASEMGWAAHSLVKPDAPPPAPPIDVPPAYKPQSGPMMAENALPYSLDELVHTRRELGNRIKNFAGRELNELENDQNSANLLAWKGMSDVFHDSLGGHTGQGNVAQSDVDALLGANKTFSTVADVNKNLASGTNRANKTPMARGNETAVGGTAKALESAATHLTGVNAQYGLGQGLEKAGTAFSAAGELVGAANALGWTGNQHPEISQAAQQNPGAPKAVVEQKANDKMKEKLGHSWYNSLMDKAAEMWL